MDGPNLRERAEARAGLRRRAADAPVVLVSLDRTAPRPLYRQVYEGLREAILAGRLRPGERLPSTRTLAADLDVSRNTIVLAFSQLRTEGYVFGQRGGGTRVRDVPPDALLNVRPGVAGALPATRGRDAAEAVPTKAAAAEAVLSARGAELSAAGAGLARAGGTEPVPFRLGVPALDAFPSRLWARLTARRWRRGGGVYLGDGDAAGEPALREAIATHVSNARGARCGPDQVFVVNGAQQALDLVARILLDPGDAAWVEDPGYPVAHTALTAAGGRLVPVPVDDEGLDVAAGERLASNARLAYVTPSHQFPLGSVMGAPRRLALLRWARAAGAWVVEDDYDSEFRFNGQPLPCVQGLDAERCAPGEVPRVFYVGSFSKTLAPGLRLGYLIVPAALVDAVRAARAAIDRHPPASAQGVLADFIGEGHYARHVRRVRALYAERQAILVRALRTELDGLLSADPDAAGLHLVAWLPPGVDDREAEAATRAEGVRGYAVSRYALARSTSPRPGGLLLGYAGFDGSAIREGVVRLGRALRTVGPAPCTSTRSAR